VVHFTESEWLELVT